MDLKVSNYLLKLEDDQELLIDPKHVIGFLTQRMSLRVKESKTVAWRLILYLNKKIYLPSVGGSREYVMGVKCESKQKARDSLSGLSCKETRNESVD